MGLTRVEVRAYTGLSGVSWGRNLSLKQTPLLRLVGSNNAEPATFLKEPCLCARL